MIKFKSNNISLGSESVAEQLRLRRQEKELKLSNIAKKLNINDKYLEALEKGEYNKLPTGVYGENYLREYALYLGLDSNELLKIFRQEINILQSPGQKQLFSKQRVKRHEFLAVPKIIKSSIIVIITIVFFIYLGFSLKKIISPPNLSIYSPLDNITISEKSIPIIGKTDSEALVLINGEQILSDTEGEFSKIVNLKDGINIITITASKKYGRDNTVKRQILVKNE